LVGFDVSLIHSPPQTGQRQELSAINGGYGELHP